MDCPRTAKYNNLFAQYLHWLCLFVCENFEFLITMMQKFCRNIHGRTFIDVQMQGLMCALFARCAVHKMCYQYKTFISFDVSLQRSVS